MCNVDSNWNLIASDPQVQERAGSLSRIQERLKSVMAPKSEFQEEVELFLHALGKMALRLDMDTWMDVQQTLLEAMSKACREAQKKRHVQAPSNHFSGLSAAAAPTSLPYMVGWTATQASNSFNPGPAQQQVLATTPVQRTIPAHQGPVANNIHPHMQLQLQPQLQEQHQLSQPQQPQTSGTGIPLYVPGSPFNYQGFISPTWSSYLGTSRRESLDNSFSSIASLGRSSTVPESLTTPTAAGTTTTTTEANSTQ